MITIDLSGLREQITGITLPAPERVVDPTAERVVVGAGDPLTFRELEAYGFVPAGTADRLAGMAYDVVRGIAELVTGPPVVRVVLSRDGGGEAGFKSEGDVVGYAVRDDFIRAAAERAMERTTGGVR